jgi:hypothetical protein
MCTGYSGLYTTTGEAIRKKDRLRKNRCATYTVIIRDDVL